jgi:ribosomal-protein-alanine acetyltransferase
VLYESGAMPTLKPKRAPAVRIRTAKEGDLDALMELEYRAFNTDRLSRRSLRRFLKAPSADLLVAEADGRLAGTAILLFRPRSKAARLYSIAVMPHMSGRGIAPLLLQAVEELATTRGCRSIRLEVHQANHAAIARYHKSGYREFGRRRHYYDDGGDALRFEKDLIPEISESA